MQHGYVEVNGVPTGVTTFGRWIEDKPEPGDVKDIVIFIPGNPGTNKFSLMFMQAMYEQLGFPIWAISYAGHEPSPNTKKYKDPPLKGNEKLYDLQGQVNHKIAFFEQYVPKDARIHLVAHSIGTYMSLKLLEVPEINNRIVKCYLLFPTIEHMSVTRNGTFFLKVLKPLLWLLFFMAWIFTLLPTFMQTFLIYLYLKINDIPKMHLKPILYFINPQILRKVFFLALDEMDCVKERNNLVLLENVSKIKLYYGADDGWVPVSYYHKIKEDIPNIDAELCTRNFLHAYVLKSSRDVGNMVASWIKETL